MYLTWIDKYSLLAVRGRAATSKANDAINGDLVQEHKEKIQGLLEGGGGSSISCSRKYIVVPSKIVKILLLPIMYDELCCYEHSLVVSKLVRLNREQLDTIYNAG